MLEGFADGECFFIGLSWLANCVRSASCLFAGTFSVGEQAMSFFSLFSVAVWGLSSNFAFLVWCHHFVAYLDIVCHVLPECASRSELQKFIQTCIAGILALAFMQVSVAASMGMLGRTLSSNIKWNTLTAAAKHTSA